MAAKAIATTNGLSRLGQFLRQLGQSLLLVRFSLLTVFIVWVTVLGVQQCEDLFVALAEDFPRQGSDVWRIVALALTALLCGLMVWYGARTMQRFRFLGLAASHSGVLPGLKRWLPRALGASIPFVVALGFRPWPWPPATASGLTGSRVVLCALFLTETAALFAFVTARRWIAQRRAWPWLAVNYDALSKDLPDWRAAGPAARRVFVGLLCLNFVSMAAFIVFGYWLSLAMGGLAILLLALTLITGVGSVLTYFGSRYRVPMLTGLAGLALVASIWNDNHAVRTVPRSTAPARMPAALGAASVGDYFEGWLRALPDAAAGPVDARPIPVFLVSAEGGGIRAAYWTAVVLGALQDRLACEGLDFSRNVFSISAVSGGSLGAATFVANLGAGPKPAVARPQHIASAPAPAGRADSRTASRVPCPDPGAGPIASRSRAMLGSDFLSPTIGAALFPDLLQRFWPFPWFPDRAAALEHAWERAWRDAQPADDSGPDPFEQPFDALWSGAPYARPLLFLNSTVVETGQRALVEPLFALAPLGELLGSPCRRVAPARAGFADAVLVRDLAPNAYPLSAAVHLSARFTYVSPAGRIDIAPRDVSAGGCATQPKPKLPKSVHLVDGGYFDNSGAVTSQEILVALRRRLQALRKTDPALAQRAQLIAIHITNEPTPSDGAERLNGQGLHRGWAPELTSPVTALLNTRSARGYQAREALRQNVTGDGGDAYFFTLGRKLGQIPLGWALSRATQDRIGVQAVEANRAKLERVVAAMECYGRGTGCR